MRKENDKTAVPKVFFLAQKSCYPDSSFLGGQNDAQRTPRSPPFDARGSFFDARVVPFDARGPFYLARAGEGLQYLGGPIKILQTSPHVGLPGGPFGRPGSSI